MTNHRDDLSLDQLEDDSLHALLQMAVRSERTEDEFVRQVEERLDARVVPPPIAAPPVVPPPVILPARRPLPSVQRSSAVWPLAAALAVLLIFVAGLGGVWYGRRTTPAGPAIVERESSRPLHKPVVILEGSASTDIPDGDDLPVARNATEGVPYSAPSDIPNGVSPREQPPTTPVVWRVGGPQDGRLPAGRHELALGSVDIPGPDGTRLAVFAPTSLEIRGNTISLQRGKLRTIDPLLSDSRVVTPTARITPESGLFDIGVDEAGATEIDIQSGEIAMTPGSGADRAGHSIRLTADGWNRASIAAAGAEAGAPVTCSLLGSDERFCGLVSVGGEALQFATPDGFADFCRQVTDCFEKTPERLAEDWPRLVKSLGGVGGGAISVKTGDGKEDFRSLDDLFRLVETIPAGGNSSFEGSINVNGTETKFNSAADFRAARQKLLDSLPIFGDDRR